MVNCDAVRHYVQRNYPQFTVSVGSSPDALLISGIGSAFEQTLLINDLRNTNSASATAINETDVKVTFDRTDIAWNWILYALLAAVAAVYILQ